MWHRKHRYMRLDGSSKIAARRDMVADFQNRADIFVFLLSTRAGGLGINLTAADTVSHSFAFPFLLLFLYNCKSFDSIFCSACKIFSWEPLMNDPEILIFSCTRKWFTKVLANFFFYYFSIILLSQIVGSQTCHWQNKFERLWNFEFNYWRYNEAIPLTSMYKSRFFFC